jgi:hypothetical protein
MALVKKNAAPANHQMQKTKQRAKCKLLCGKSSRVAIKEKTKLFTFGV